MSINSLLRMPCPCCLQMHEIRTIKEEESISFKGEKVVFEAEYSCCEHTGDSWETEKQIKKNDVAMKETYRKKKGLLTSGEIVNIRKQYNISQKDLALVLGWGGKTITRYEGYQVQDMAHDVILRKIADDPGWYLELLKKAKGLLTNEAYERYELSARDMQEKQECLYAQRKDAYIETIRKEEFEAGRRLERLLIANQMKKTGLSLELICKVTSLTREKVEAVTEG